MKTGIKTDSRIQIFASLDTTVALAADAEKMFKDKDAKKKAKEKKKGADEKKPGS